MAAVFDFADATLRPNGERSRDGGSEVLIVSVHASEKRSSLKGLHHMHLIFPIC